LTDTDNELQRLLNDAKKEELSLKFGARFSPTPPSLPPEVEGAWLNHVEQFELLCQNARTITVREYIGGPPTRPLGEIPAQELEAELDRFFELLSANNIAVHFGRSVSESEAYRFITEELLGREIEDIRMDGLTLNFLYEEFHPDDEQDATMTVEDFLFALFNRKESMLLSLLCRPDILITVSEAYDSSGLSTHLQSFLRGVLTFLDWDADSFRCTIDGDKAAVEARVCWSGLEIGTLHRMNAEGRALVDLRKSDGFWYITGASIPGVDLPPR
jgi:hypothetical protein